MATKEDCRKALSQKRQFGNVICRRRDLISTLTCGQMAGADSRGGGRSTRPFKKCRTACVRMRYQRSMGVNCSALVVRPRKKSAMRAKTWAAQCASVGAGNAQGRLTGVTKALGDAGQEQ
jgi:hypothetical protein